MSVDQATRAQQAAADPTHSTWVSANAGSGKTTVLTNRVARLLLDGTPPQNILCLTYTNAAAANMQIKLFERLGKWAMMADDDLVEDLNKLGVADVGAALDLPRARRLFAQALETPGGLKIQTIHAFCASVLRRFPLEAGVSPNFTEIDERTQTRMREDCLERMAEGAEAPLVADLAKVLGGSPADGLLAEIAGKARLFDGPPCSPRAALGLPEGLTPDQVMQDTLPPDFTTLIREMAAALSKSKTQGGPKKAAALAALCTDLPLAERFEGLARALLNKDFSAPKNPVPADVTKTDRNISAAIIDLTNRVKDAHDVLATLKIAEKSEMVSAFARAFVARYRAMKQDHGALDFDDLIDKAVTLLSDSDTAQWVLYKLDGTIDHILVDEAQDTSPRQWSIIATLAEDFTAGDSARRQNRTIFVVGDEKQSIFSFQGADPARFANMREHFAQRLQAIGSTLVTEELNFSFRSASPILHLVDAVFQRDGAVGSGAAHRAFFDQMPGCVDLWPMVPKPEATDPAPWDSPVDEPLADDPAIVLAGQVADHVADLLASASLPARDGPRPIRAGDILILVRRRNLLFQELIQALKTRGIAVAGADRMKLGQELAVRDLMALLQFLALPEDDLNLACLLRSPLCGLSEDDLFSLAWNRPRSLWEALRNSRDTHPRVMAFLDDMMTRADFDRPHDLLVRALNRHDGWSRLTARLGDESADGIEAFLNEALAFERTAPPTLTGFISWFQAEDVEVKRQMDQAGDQVRVMTVHGAKGLEAPIVILPDTAKRGGNAGGRGNLAEVDGVAIWNQGKTKPKALASRLAERADAEKAEQRRLLYVALTRAENWTIICGGGETGGEDCWYDLVQSGMHHAGAVTHSFANGPGLRLCSETWSLVGPRSTARPAVPDPALPDWARQPAPKAGQPPKMVGPSKLWSNPKDSENHANPGGVDPETAARRGSLLHRMLEEFPVRPTDQRTAHGALLAKEAGATGPDLDICMGRAQAILSDPALSHLFAPDTVAEAGIVAPLPDGRLLEGYIDRLVPTADGWLIVDYKSHAAPPGDVGATPTGILVQLGAYTLAMEQVYPNVRINAAILWTATGILMPVPHDIVMDALQSATTS